MKTEFIFFDLDNTLWDFRAAARAAVYDFAVAHALPRPDAIADDFDCFNCQVWHEYEHGTLPREDIQTERFRRLFAYHGVTVDETEAGEWFLENYIRYSVPVEGAVAAVRNLAVYSRLGILTNGLNPERKVKLLGLEDCFEVILSVRELTAHKPKKEFFHQACAFVGVLPEQCLYIGDDYLTDTIGALDAGLHAVWFARGQREQDIREYLVCDRMDDLAGLLLPNR